MQSSTSPDRFQHLINVLSVGDIRMVVASNGMKLLFWYVCCYARPSGPWILYLCCFQDRNVSSSQTNDNTQESHDKAFGITGDGVRQTVTSRFSFLKKTKSISMKIFIWRCAEVGRAFWFLLSTILTQCHECLLSAIRSLQLPRRVWFAWGGNQNKTRNTCWGRSAKLQPHMRDDINQRLVLLTVRFG